MLFGGSQIVSTGFRTSNGSGELDFQGSWIKAFEEVLPRIATDMSVYIYLDNQFFDPYSVNYVIFDPSGAEVANQSHVPASRFSAGWYYANFAWWNMTSLKKGVYRIVWEITRTAFDTSMSKADEFLVYAARAEVCAASDISSGADGLSGQYKQSGTCNTLNYGVGLVVRSSCGCGCA
jgi:hypothetical protein